MALSFYNSLSKKKEKFIPINKDSVRLYTCGPTVYDVAHIGNFRTFIFEDLLKRFLLYKDYSVTHIMNITDVDDKTIRRSIKEDKTLAELTQKYTDLFFKDLTWMKVIPADAYPKATDHVNEMIEMIQILIEKEFAYLTKDNSIFFKISKYPDYGKLVNIKSDQLQSSERISEDEYSKDNPRDFALWKGHKPEDGDIWWDSPWGKGRPGWHIECSAMSMKYLGDFFDLHCGGVDNIFPHHENEIAQSRAATDSNFVKTWIHAEHLQIEGDKMSKSEENFYSIEDLKKQGFIPEVIRYLLLNGHYRTKLNFSLSKQNEGEQAIQRIIDISSKLKYIVNDTEVNPDLFPKSYGEFIDALEDDLDTPKALAVLFTWIREMNKKIEENELRVEAALKGVNFLKTVNNILGIIPPQLIIPENIQRLINKRIRARNKKNWNESDRIRDELYKLGWKIEDTPDGSLCKPVRLYKER
ncbi:MAG: cysteine--tRNA ligase [Candidatus Neomarinimicrobiota bacterium]|nr:cysteine--tRNA ligase [Candidatus Neomarinimicrobiota bacterium]